MDDVDQSRGMIRDGYDQQMTIAPHNFRYLYQGVDPAASGPYGLLPWRLGLITENSARRATEGGA